MMAYPTPDDIEFKWRASRTGICIIVEGETELDDAWFYSQWFSDRARQITFFPQDGWEKVIIAVENLRARLGAKRVYGIVDRDFEESVTWDPFPTSGILRTPKYTLENYLLNVASWFQWIQPYNLRSPKKGWNTLEEVQATLETLYRECLSLSAYNWVLCQARNHDPVAFKVLPDNAYKEHPKAIEGLDVPSRLRGTQTRMMIPDDLGQMYLDRLAVLQRMSLPELEQVVSGKYVLALLHERFPLRLSGRHAWDDVLGAYIYACPAPPNDLSAMIDLILQDAHV
jgi:hypothetical protein